MAIKDLSVFHWQIRLMAGEESKVFRAIKYNKLEVHKMTKPLNRLQRYKSLPLMIEMYNRYSH